MTTIEPASAALRQWVAAQLNLAPAAFALEPASTDASFRRYFRASANGRSWVVMDAGIERASCIPFVGMARLLAAGGLHAPAVLAEDLEQGWLLLGDLGHRTYLEVLDADNADALFDDAIPR